MRRSTMQGAAHFQQCTLSSPILILPFLAMSSIITGAAAVWPSALAQFPLMIGDFAIGGWSAIGLMWMRDCRFCGDSR